MMAHSVWHYLDGSIVITAKRVGVVFAAVGMTIAAMVSPASAAASSSNPVYTNGTVAGDSWFNRGNPAFFHVWDGKCDGEPVYVKWNINHSGWRSYMNYDGCGTTRKVELQGGSFNIEFSTCVDDDVWVDSCSAHTKSDNNG